MLDRVQSCAEAELDRFAKGVFGTCSVLLIDGSRLMRQTPPCTKELKSMPRAISLVLVRRMPKPNDGILRLTIQDSSGLQTIPCK